MHLQWKQPDLHSYMHFFMQAFMHSRMQCGAGTSSAFLPGWCCTYSLTQPSVLQLVQMPCAWQLLQGVEAVLEEMMTSRACLPADPQVQPTLIKLEPSTRMHQHPSSGSTIGLVSNDVYAGGCRGYEACRCSIHLCWNTSGVQYECELHAQDCVFQECQMCLDGTFLEISQKLRSGAVLAGLALSEAASTKRRLTFIRTMQTLALVSACKT